MKTRLTLIIALVIGLTGIGHTLFAADYAPAAKGAETQIIPAVQIQGIMKESTDGFSLVGANLTYQLKDWEEIDGMTDETLKGMIGKLVKVSGDLEKSEAGLFIHVKNIETIG